MDELKQLEEAAVNGARNLLDPMTWPVWKFAAMKGLSLNEWGSIVAITYGLICIAIVRIFTPLRVEERAEKVGLDVSEHGENAYPSFNGLD